MARHFLWNAQRHQKLNKELKDQVSPGTPLANILGDARIGSYADPSLKSFSIGNNEAIQAFRDCLNGDQRGRLDSGREVKVLGYNEDGIPHKLKLKKNRDGHTVLEGPWESIMRKNGWSRETRMCIWGFRNGGSNRGEPRFVFTDDNI